MPSAGGAIRFSELVRAVCLHRRPMQTNKVRLRLLVATSQDARLKRRVRLGWPQFAFLRVLQGIQDISRHCRSCFRPPWNSDEIPDCEQLRFARIST
jgi:hypothetical protein